MPKAELCDKGYWRIIKWDKVLKSGLSKFFKGCLPRNLLGPLLNTLSQMTLTLGQNYEFIWKELISYGNSDIITKI